MTHMKLQVCIALSNDNADIIVKDAKTDNVCLLGERCTQENDITVIDEITKFLSRKKIKMTGVQQI